MAKSLTEKATQLFEKEKDLPSCIDAFNSIKEHLTKRLEEKALELDGEKEKILSTKDSITNGK